MSDSLLPELQPAHLKETGLDSTTVYRGHFLHAVRDTVQLPDGKRSVREYIKHPGAVMIIPMLDDGRVVVERQYRYPLQRAMIEFPAGKLIRVRTSWPVPGASCARRPAMSPASGRAPACCTRCWPTRTSSSRSGSRAD